MRCFRSVSTRRFAYWELAVTFPGSICFKISKEWRPLLYLPFWLFRLALFSLFKTSCLGIISMFACSVGALNLSPKKRRSAGTSARNHDSMHCTIKCACLSSAPSGRCQLSRESKWSHGFPLEETGASLSTNSRGSSSGLTEHTAVRNRFSVSFLLPHATTLGMCRARPAFSKNLWNPSRQSDLSLPRPPPST